MENKKPPLKWLVGAIAFIIIFVLWFIVIEEYTLQTGQEVYLETIPVDPRDPLRGDYVILRYAIERDEQVTNFISQRNLQQWDTLYISLVLDTTSIGSVSSVSTNQPSSWLFITWKVWSWNSLDLWIWKYFVPEWTGREIEKVRSDMQVLTLIDTYGTAKIKSLYYKGIEINPDTFVAP